MTFDEACARLFKVEGFYSNNPDDAGGATKYGITMQMWAAYVRRAVRAVDVMAIAEIEAKSFYRDLFWDHLRCEEIENDSLRYAVFDQAVNRGPGTVIRQMQRVLNDDFGAKLKEDGLFGDETLNVLNLKASEFLIPFIFSCQIAYCRLVQKRPSQLAFLTGWMSRTQSLITLAVKGGK